MREEDVFDDGPEFEVRGMEQEDETAGLGVEGGGGGEECGLEESAELGVGDGGRPAEGVEGAAGGEGAEEGGAVGGHCGGRG